MRALFFGCFSAFLLSIFLTPLIRRLALRLGALDPLSARKVPGRSVTVPRMGGLGIAAAFYAVLLLLWLYRSTLTVGVLGTGPAIQAILLCGLPVLLLGCLDDLRGVSATGKLTVQVTVAVLLFYSGLRIGGQTSLVSGWELPAWLSFLLTVLWITGVINAVNLIDGLDGLAAGVALFALCSTTLIAVLRGDLMLALLTATLSGAVLGFLVFNIHPASIFMGDAGSMFLGYLLATTSIWTVQKAATVVLLVLPAVALGLPLLDTSLTISRRLLSGRPVMQADRDHVHHRLLGKGLSHGQTVVLLYAVCAVFSGLSVGMVLAGRILQKVLLALAVLFALGLSYLLGYATRGPEGLWHALLRRRRNREVLRCLSDLGGSIRHAEGLGDLQQAVRDFARVLGTVDLDLVIYQRPRPLAAEQEQAPSSESGDDRVRGRASGQGLSYPILSSAGVLGQIESHTDEVRISPDDRVAVQILCDMLAPQVARLSGGGERER